MTRASDADDHFHLVFENGRKAARTGLRLSRTHISTVNSRSMPLGLLGSILSILWNLLPLNGEGFSWKGSRLHLEATAHLPGQRLEQYLNSQLGSAFGSQPELLSSTDRRCVSTPSADDKPDRQERVQSLIMLGQSLAAQFVKDEYQPF